MHIGGQPLLSVLCLLSPIEERGFATRLKLQSGPGTHFLSCRVPATFMGQQVSTGQVAHEPGPGTHSTATCVLQTELSAGISKK